MWSNNSPFPKKFNKSSYILKSSFSEKIKDNISNNIFSEITFKTPIKEEINNSVDNNNINPFKLDLKYYLENQNSSGPFPFNHINNHLFSFNSPPNRNQNLLFQDEEKDIFLNKKISDISSFKISPESMVKNINYSSLNNSNNKENLLLTENEKKDKENYDGIFKKNLYFLFNKVNEVNNDNSEQYLNHHYDNNLNNSFKNEDKENIQNNNINNKFIFNLNIPIKKDSSKKIFECSGSTFTTISSIINPKKKRLRKNNEQLFLLKKFYSEHKYWNKSQIKEISNKIGIKENKVYKWLWDQRNKESKNAKFIINKKLEKNVV